MNRLSPESESAVDGGSDRLAKEQLRAELQSLLAGDTVLRLDELLAKRTTLRVGGCADLYVEPASEVELSAVLQWCGRRHIS